jgi:hypothetical protein
MVEVQIKNGTDTVTFNFCAITMFISRADIFFF